ncbi:hypothetical protein HEK131_04660 [Streptomyces seoulensis]|nr:hypothetical protein HEK131_04660 [Streptomyces seoulensis]
MAGMPGLLVAPVFSGAQVITRTVPSSAAPPVPGTVPQPAVSAAQAASAPAYRAARRGREEEVELGELSGVPRLPVMGTHDSRTSPTGE